MTSEALSSTQTRSTEKAEKPILSVRELTIRFPSEAGTVHAARGVDFDLYPGRTLGIVGESGSGKSVTSLAVMGLLPDSAAISGSIKLDGRELIGMKDKDMSAIRGKDIGMIFQDPLSSLTPVFNVGEQIVEAIQCHSSMSKSDAWKRAIELLDMVGIPEPHKRVKAFPHEFSGGMRQRVVIAIAIANNPRILIADEPTTTLDVTVQAQILDLIKVAQKETGAATIMITHDMGVVAETADDVLVMYAGRPVERADVWSIFHNPKMPYTIGLLESTPRVDKQAGGALPTIPGHPPMLIDLPQGCPFAARCPVVIDKCREKEPLAIPLDDKPDHNTACFRSHEVIDQMIDNTRMYPPPVLADDILAGTPRNERSTVLSVTNLRKEFPLLKGALVKRRVGTVHAVRGVDIDIKQGECFAIVGESGSGKTTTLLEIMDLNPPEGTAIELCGESAARFTRKSRLKARQNIQITDRLPGSYGLSQPAHDGARDYYRAIKEPWFRRGR